MIRIPQPRDDSDESDWTEPRLAGDTVEAAIATDPAGNLDSIRSGSPFAPGTNRPMQSATDRGSLQMATIDKSFADDGPLRYTAGGALIASALMLSFATAASLWFPTGGIAITALGISLAILGIQSQRTWESLTLLGIHSALLAFCVNQWRG